MKKVKRADQVHMVEEALKPANALVAVADAVCDI